MGSDAKDVLAVIGWYWRDWRSSTARAVLSPLARGIYRELLDAHYGEADCSLPDDDRHLAALAGVPLKMWLAVKTEVLPWLPLTVDGRRRNQRIHHVWTQAQGYRQTKRSAGAKGAAKRWQRHGTAIDPPLANDGYPDPKPYPHPNSNPPTPRRGAEPMPSDSTSDASSNGATPAAAARPRTPPADSLADLFRSILPNLPQPARPLAAGIRDACLAALRRDPSLDLWRSRFERAGRSAFLTGQRTSFRATLVWLVGPKNVAKLEAGQYDDHEPPAPPSANISSVQQAYQQFGFADDEADTDSPTLPPPDRGRLLSLTRAVRRADP